MITITHSVFSQQYRIWVIKFKHRIIMAVTAKKDGDAQRSPKTSGNSIRLRWGMKQHLWKFFYGWTTWKTFRQTRYKCKVYRSAELLSSSILVAGLHSTNVSPYLPSLALQGIQKRLSQNPPPLQPSQTFQSAGDTSLQLSLSTKTTQCFLLQSMTNNLKRCTLSFLIWELPLCSWPCYQTRLLLVLSTTSSLPRKLSETCPWSSLVLRTSLVLGWGEVKMWK